MSGVLRRLAERALDRAAPVRPQKAPPRGRRPFEAEELPVEQALASTPPVTTTLHHEAAVQSATHRAIPVPEIAHEPMRERHVPSPRPEPAAIAAAPMRMPAVADRESAPRASAVLREPVAVTEHRGDGPLPRERIAPAVADANPTPAVQTPPAKTATPVGAVAIRPARAVPSGAAAPRVDSITAKEERAATEVHVTIGRIDVMALPSAPARAPTTARAPRCSRSAVSLADYLRNGARVKP